MNTAVKTERSEMSVKIRVPGNIVTVKDNIVTVVVPCGPGPIFNGDALNRLTIGMSLSDADRFIDDMAEYVVTESLKRRITVKFEQS